MHMCALLILLLHRLELLRGEESSVVAGEVVEGLVDLAFAVWQDHYLEEQSFPYAIQAAKSSLLQIIEVQIHIHSSSDSSYAIGKVKVGRVEYMYMWVHVVYVL